MVRHEAAEALGGIATDECLPVLKEFSQRSDVPSVVRESCEVALDMVSFIPWIFFVRKTLERETHGVLCFLSPVRVRTIERVCPAPFGCTDCSSRSLKNIVSSFGQHQFFRLSFYLRFAHWLLRSLPLSFSPPLSLSLWKHLAYVFFLVLCCSTCLFPFSSSFSPVLYSSCTLSSFVAKIFPTHVFEKKKKISKTTRHAIHLSSRHHSPLSLSRILTRLALFSSFVRPQPPQERQNEE